MKYTRITQAYDRYEAAYHYLEVTFGIHVPHMYPDLVGYTVQCAEGSVPEHQFKRDAKVMYYMH